MDIKSVIINSLSAIIEKDTDELRLVGDGESLQNHGFDSIKFIRFIVDLDVNADDIM